MPDFPSKKKANLWHNWGNLKILVSGQSIDQSYGFREILRVIEPIGITVTNLWHEIRRATAARPRVFENMSSQDTVSSVVAQIEPRPASSDHGARRLLSVVIPCYNESANIESLFARLFPVLDTLPMDWEVVCVNDGSRDDTLDRLVAVHAREPRVRVVDLSRNFGKEAALSAGLSPPKATPWSRWMRICSIRRNCCPTLSPDGGKVSTW